MSEKISRRKFLAAVGGIAAAAVVGGVAWYLYTSAPTPTPTATTTTPTAARPSRIRYSTHPFYFPPDAEKEYEKITGIDVETTYLEFFVMTQKQLADPTAWDVAASGRYRPIIAEGLARPIPVEKVPRWRPDKVLDMFYHVEKYFKPAQVKRFNYLLWHEYGKTLIAVPVMWNFDSVTYLPEFLPYEERGGTKRTLAYSELWNPEWKGRTGMQDEAFTVFSETANYLEATEQMTFSGAITSLTEEEVDAVFNYLLPYVKQGFIKTFWFSYGDIVSLFSTREVWLASTWQPVCFDTRKAGTPAYYAALQHGPFFWYNSGYVSSLVSPEVAEEGIRLLNWHLELYTQMLYTRQGYPSPAWAWEDYKNAMGDEFYGWFYEGKSTYLPIEEVMKIIWPNKPEFATLPERLQNALFLPDVYFKHFWTGEPPRKGTPHPRGNVRDLGSVDDKQKMTRYFLSPDLPDNNEYYVRKFEELKAALPV
jgi:spermidine/putrescine-binding protein